MRILHIISCITFLFTAIYYNSEAIEGYYKDVFVDEGTSLSGPGRMPALDLVGFTHEWMEIEADTALQRSVMFHNANDDNGALIYPDGEARFAIIYYHGGSTSHYDDIKEEGQNILRSHYYKGGSQFGSCAGCYLLSRWRLNIWPGRLDGPNTAGDRVVHTLPDYSPLHDYFNFGPDNLVTDIVHNNGGSFDTSEVPEGTVILAVHKTVPLNPEMEGYGAIWGWKDNDTTGRAVGITSHPEGSSEDGKRKEMGGILLYLKDGLAPPDIKHELKRDEQIIMNKVSADNDPLHAKIGDRQYHHFIIELPYGAEDLKITIDADEGFDMHLFANKDTLAYVDSADYQNVNAGPDKELTIATVPRGTWYAGVKCATTVESEEVNSGNDSYYQYSGKLSVLNGVAYAITATWKETGILVNSGRSMNSRFTVAYNAGNVTIMTGNVQARRLQIFDVRGRLCWEKGVSGHGRQYTWRPQSAGMYIVSLETGKGIVTKRLNIVR
jgi:hypothetical protein